MRLLIGILLCCTLSLAAQTVSGTTTAIGQTATASASLTPALQLQISFSGCVQTAWSANPANLWAGAAFTCTVTANQPPPALSTFTVAISVVQPAGAVVTASPSPVVIPTGATSATFTVSGK